MHRFKLFRNDQGLYRVQIHINGIYRWLLDEDLMMAIISSHRSKILTFDNAARANEAISDYLKKEQILQDLARPKNPQPEPVVTDTFQEVDDE